MELMRTFDAGIHQCIVYNDDEWWYLSLSLLLFLRPRYTLLTS